MIPDVNTLGGRELAPWPFLSSSLSLPLAWLGSATHAASASDRKRRSRRLLESLLIEGCSKVYS
jgi:hypothetical protein